MDSCVLDALIGAMNDCHAAKLARDIDGLVGQTEKGEVSLK